MKTLGWLLLTLILAGAGYYLLDKPEPLIRYQTGAQAVPIIDAYTTPIAPKVAVKREDYSTTTMLIIEPEKDVQKSPSYTPEQALAMMQQSAEHGDTRQPELLRRTTPEKRASAEQLADAKSYAAYEQQQTKAVIANYAAILDRLPSLWERVNQGATDPRISRAQYREALEALEQLELMRGRLEAEHPELLLAPEAAEESP